MQFHSRTLSLLSSLWPLTDFLYILQQEDYRTGRYAGWLPRFFFRRHIQKRNKLVSTRRVQLVGAVGVALQVATFLSVRLFVFGDDTNLLIGGVLVVAILICTPLFVLWAHTLTLPFFKLAHARIQKKAAAKMASIHNLTVVMVVGSFGKTTAREYITTMLRNSRVVLTPPGNINTEVGVAKWVLTSLPSSTEVLVLEADAYAIGDIARMCALARPHIAVITALGDQHLERLGDVKTLVQATQEVFAEAHETAKLIAREDVWAQLSEAGYSAYTGKNSVHADTVPAAYNEAEDVLISLPHTRRSAALLALAVAHTLEVPARFAFSALTHTAVPRRRQEITKIHAGAHIYDGMDDSYNISLTTARAALRAARGEADRLRKKLLVVVAGIPEAADLAGDHTHLALACLETAEHTVLIESACTPYLLPVFAHEKTKVSVLPSVKNSVLLALPSRFHPDEWFVLLFNELGDLYH